MNRPGTSMSVYTKIATVYQERLREWSQFDGSIRDLNARSGMAAFAAGATPDNLAIPEIANNVKQASEFVMTLTGPTYASTFPTRALDPTKVQRGKDIYLNAGPEGPSPITGKPVRFTLLISATAILKRPAGNGETSRVKSRPWQRYKRTLNG